MAHALCKTCGKLIYWKASRGARLADLRCQCGGELRAANHQGAEVGPKTKGRKAVHCAVCGRRRTSPSNYKRTARPGMYVAWGAAGKVLVDVPAAAVICWHHEPIVPVPSETVS